MPSTTESIIYYCAFTDHRLSMVTIIILLTCLRTYTYIYTCFLCDGSRVLLLSTDTVASAGSVEVALGRVGGWDIIRTCHVFIIPALDEGRGSKLICL